MKTIVVSIDNKGVDVKFKGEWNRVDVETAYKAMIRKLPAHIAERRRRMEDGNRANTDRKTER